MRLTEGQKSVIINRAIDKAFDKRIAALAAKENMVALQVYDLIYPPDIVGKMGKLPHGFFLRESSVFIGEGSETSRGDVRLSLDNLRPIAAEDRTWNRPRWEARPKHDAKLLSAARLIDQKKTYLREDIKTAKAKLGQFLAGITTWKRLAEVWPEGKEYYKTDVPHCPAPNLPAITSDEVQGLLKDLAAKR